MSLVETRYAEALVSLALEKDMIEAMGKDLNYVLKVFLQHKDLRNLLLNVDVDIKVKREILDSIFSKTINMELKSFLKLMLNKDRISILPGMLKEYDRLADKKQNVLKIKIFSAFPLDKHQIKSIEEKYKKIYGTCSAKAELQIDKSLIGGIRLKIGDRVIDASLSTRIKLLSEAITSS